MFVSILHLSVDQAVSSVGDPASVHIYYDPPPTPDSWTRTDTAASLVLLPLGSWVRKQPPK